jgi:hypothetical protein
VSLQPAMSRTAAAPASSLLKRGFLMIASMAPRVV